MHSGWETALQSFALPTPTLHQNFERTPPSTAEGTHGVHTLVKGHSPPGAELKILLRHPGRKHEWENGKSGFYLFNVYSTSHANELVHWILTASQRGGLCYHPPFASKEMRV